jgi:hypothetical protein
LEDNGYKTTNLEDGLDGAAVIVVSGLDSDLFGDQTIATEATVIEAEGLTAEEVLAEVEKVMRFIH